MLKLFKTTPQVKNCLPTDENLEVVEHLGGAALRVAVHDLQQLARELEGGRLEADATGAIGQHKAKVDMNDVAAVVQEDVAVMAVLDLQQVAHQAVGGHALCKIALRLHTLGRTLQQMENVRLQSIGHTITPKYFTLMNLAKKWSAREVAGRERPLSWCRDMLSGTISISAVRLEVTNTSYGRKYSGSCASCPGRS